MFLLVGLGNHGHSYTHTRHNIGWTVVEKLVHQHDGSWHEATDHHALIARFMVNQQKLLACLPLTYMNLSGQAVSSLFNYYHLSLEELLIIHDDMDLPVGTLLFAVGRGDAGHNGVRSIHEQLGSQQPARLRLGIGHPNDQQSPESFVLSTFTSTEQLAIDAVIDQACTAIIDWSVHGTTWTMNKWNGRSDKP